MQAFPKGGSGYLDTYWDQDWAEKKCKLVHWQTGWSVLFPEDFDACGEAKYPGEYVPEGKTEESCSTPEGDPSDNSGGGGGGTVTESESEAPVTESEDDNHYTEEDEIDC